MFALLRLPLLASVDLIGPNREVAGAGVVSPSDGSSPIWIASLICH